MKLKMNTLKFNHSFISSVLVATVISSALSSCSKDNTLSDEMRSKNKWHQSTVLKQNDLELIYIFRCRKTSPDKSQHLYFSLYGDASNLTLDSNRKPDDLELEGRRVLYRSKLNLETQNRSQESIQTTMNIVSNPVVLQISKFTYSKEENLDTYRNEDIYSLPVDVETSETQEGLVEYKALANQQTLAYIKGNGINELASVLEGDVLALVSKLKDDESNSDVTVKNLSKLAEVLDSMPLSKVECL